VSRTDHLVRYSVAPPSPGVGTTSLLSCVGSQSIVWPGCSADMRKLRREGWKVHPSRPGHACDALPKYRMVTAAKQFVDAEIRWTGDLLRTTNATARRRTTRTVARSRSRSDGYFRLAPATAEVFTQYTQNETATDDVVLTFSWLSSHRRRRKRRLKNRGRRDEVFLGRIPGGQMSPAASDRYRRKTSRQYEKMACCS